LTPLYISVIIRLTQIEETKMRFLYVYETLADSENATGIGTLEMFGDKEPTFQEIQKQHESEFYDDDDTPQPHKVLLRVNLRKVE